MYNIFYNVRGPQSTNIGIEMGVKIRDDAAKSGKDTHLLVVICMRLSKKIILLDLTKQTQFKK